MAETPEPQAPNEAPATHIFGVLGGVASGKSTVSALLAGPDGLVLAGDAYAHRVLEDPETLTWLAENFGAEALDSEGKADRAYLAGIVFEDPERLSALEGWIHPRVRARMRADLMAARERAVPRIVLDIPLLLESDGLKSLRDQVDHLVFLDVSLEERERRAVAQRGWAPGEVARREAAQMPLLEKRKAAHFLLNTGTSLSDLELQVRALLNELGLESK